MTYLSIDAASLAVGPSSSKTNKPSFFARIVEAQMKSRQRKADIAIRRALAMINEPRDQLDYAMLPFAGE